MEKIKFFQSGWKLDVCVRVVSEFVPRTVGSQSSSRPGKPSCRCVTSVCLKDPAMSAQRGDLRILFEKFCWTVAKGGDFLLFYLFYFFFVFLKIPNK